MGELDKARGMGSVDYAAATAYGERPSQKQNTAGQQSELNLEKARQELQSNKSRGKIGITKKPESNVVVEAT